MQDDEALTASTEGSTVERVRAVAAWAHHPLPLPPPETGASSRRSTVDRYLSDWTAEPARQVVDDARASAAARIVCMTNRLMALLLIAVVACGADEEAVSGRASCSDDTDDGTAAAELLAVDLDADNGNLVVEWQLADAPATSDRAFYSLSAADYDVDGEGPSYQLSVTDSSGRLETAVFDMTTARNRDVGEAGFDEGTSTMSASFPLDEIDDLDAPFTWSGAVSIDGEDVDGCPTLELSDTAEFPSDI